MAADKVDLTLEELAKLTEEVRAPDGGQGPVADKFNESYIEEYRASGGVIPGELGKLDILLLTIKGRRSGREHTTPAGYFVIDGRLVVVASMGGADKHPIWYLNLLANPIVKVEKEREAFSARAVDSKGADRERLFEGVCEGNAVFIDYQARTERLIPVIELQRLD